jgi:predicted dehydrogenase
MMADRPRVALIGAGRWGRAYVRTLATVGDACRISHIVTSRPQALTDAPPGAQVVADWRVVLGKGACDAVIIATPPDTHAPILEACLRAGRPAIVEKPLCLDVATADRLAALAAERGVPVLVDHVHLFSAGYEALRRALRQAGEPIRRVYSEGVAFGPFRSHTPPLWDRAPHDLALCLDLFGRPPASLAALAGPRNAAGAPEQSSLRLNFPDGAVAWIHTGSAWPHKRRALTVITPSRVYVLDDRAASPLQTAAVAFDDRYAQPVPEPLPLTPVPIADSTPPLTRMVRYFFDGLAGGDRRRFGLDLARQVVALLAEADRAMNAAPAAFAPSAAALPQSRTETAR